MNTNVEPPEKKELRAGINPMNLLISRNEFEINDEVFIRVLNYEFRPGNETIYVFFDEESDCSG